MRWHALAHIFGFHLPVRKFDEFAIHMKKYAETECMCEKEGERKRKSERERKRDREGERKRDANGMY